MPTTIVIQSREVPVTIVTLEQAHSIVALFDRIADSAVDIVEFAARFSPSFCGDYIGGYWNGLYIGIESDGYTHS